MIYLFDYYQINNVLNSAYVPSSVHPMQNATAGYFARYLTEKACSVFKWKLPPTWDKDYFLFVLYLAGYVGVIDTGGKYGVIPQWGTLAGYNVFYAPQRFLYSNPLIGTGDLVIHEDCELFKLQGNYHGIYDLICYYAGKMALLAEAVEMNTTNSKLSKIFWAKDQATANTFKKAFDKISSGDPMVVIDKGLKDDDEKGKALGSWEWFNDNLKQNYLVSDMLIDLRKLENEFCTDIGIPNTNTDKRERLTTDEVNANNQETFTRAELWLERLQECCERVNKKYDLDITVEWRTNPYESYSVNTRPLDAGSDAV